MCLISAQDMVKIRFSFYRKGLTVDAIDFSAEGVKKIKESTKDFSDRATVKKTDIKNSKLKKNYDIVLCNFTLHHFNKKERTKLFQNIMNHTKTSGINLVSVFVAKEGAALSKKHHGEHLYFLRQNELKDVYRKGWEILNYEQKEVKSIKGQKSAVSLEESILVRKMN